MEILKDELGGRDGGMGGIGMGMGMGMGIDDELDWGVDVLLFGLLSEG